MTKSFSTIISWCNSLYTYSGLSFTWLLRLKGSINIIIIIICNKYKISRVFHSDRPLIHEDSYHAWAEFLLDINVHHYLKPSSAPVRYDFQRANFSMINKEFSHVDWNNLFNGDDVNDNTMRFYSIINDLMFKYIPRDYCWWFPHSLFAWYVRRTNFIEDGSCIVDQMISCSSGNSDPNAKKALLKITRKIWVTQSKTFNVIQKVFSN